MLRRLKRVLRILKRVLLIFYGFINYLFGNRRNTYCYWLWDTADINEYGDVSACCYRGIGNMGNLYKHNLYDIWTKSIRLKISRWLSLNGCLDCFRWCPTLSKKEKSSTIHHQVPTEYPKMLYIRYGTFCPYNCIMCRQDHKSRIVIDNDILKKNIDWSRVDEIVLQGGEILAIENAKKFYLWLTKQINKKVNLITNGVLIDDEWADHLVKGSKWIEISVNAATEKTYQLINNNPDFIKVIDNIRRLISLKNKYSLDVKIRYHFTIIPENIHETPDAIQLADNLGCDMITYCYDRLVPSIIKKNNELREQIKAKIQHLINNNKLKIKIRANNLEQLGLLEEISSDNIIDNFR